MKKGIRTGTVSQTWWKPFLLSSELCWKPKNMLWLFESKGVWSLRGKKIYIPRNGGCRLWFRLMSHSPLQLLFCYKPFLASNFEHKQLSACIYYFSLSLSFLAFIWVQQFAVGFMLCALNLRHFMLPLEAEIWMLSTLLSPLGEFSLAVTVTENTSTISPFSASWLTGLSSCILVRAGN